MNPERIEGNWKLGYTLDAHTISSEFLGFDDFGHERYDTIRSDLGELMYRLKYRADKKACEELMELIGERLYQWMIKCEMSVIFSMPPSNKNREYQPVEFIAKELSRYTGIDYYESYLEKSSSIELKGSDILSSIDLGIHRTGSLDVQKNVLLIDDLFRTGRTMRAACVAIKTDKNVKDIYTLAITRTRRR